MTSAEDGRIGARAASTRRGRRDEREDELRAGNPLLGRTLGRRTWTPSIEFYGGLFGWEVPESENAEQTGGYRPAMKDGRPVAGMMPLMQEGQPPAWTTYVSVEDAEATAAAVTEAGGTVIAEPMDVMDLGTMAVFADPTGAVFGIWQPGTLRRRRSSSTSPARSPGTSSTPATSPRAKEFYGAVFGWGFEDNEMGETGTYTTIKLRRGAGRRHARHRTRAACPTRSPPTGSVYFAVEDTDAAVAKVKAAGGGVMVGPIDIPAGRFAIVTDPHGASFAVIALSPKRRTAPRPEPVAPSVRFRGQPFEDDKTTGAFLAEALADPGIESLTIVVAWARFGGLRRLEPEITAFRERGGSLRIVLGIDEGGATVPGLRVSIRLADEPFVFHDRTARTFHPKVYLAEGPRRRSSWWGPQT